MDYLDGRSTAQVIASTSRKYPYQMTIKDRLRVFRNKVREGSCKICYCHVPKCAGMSVRSAIAKQSFRLHERLLIPNFSIVLEATGRVSQITSRPMRDVREEILAYGLSMSRYKFVSGRPCRPRLVEEFHKSWDFVTVLRNPVDRWISEYIYNTYKAHSWAKNTLPIKEYIRSEKGRSTGMSYLLHFSNMSEKFTGNVEPYIKEALDNLSRFAVVGIAEDMDNFVRQFEACFGRRLRIPRKNSSPRGELKQQIKKDKVLMARIEELCEADRELYERIVKDVINGGKVNRSSI